MNYKVIGLTLLSSQPVHVDVWIPKRFHYFGEEWETTVFKAALRN